MSSGLEKSGPKHLEISRQLRADIASGKYGAEGRMPSEAQLVARFGVSRPTVAQALRTLDAEGLVERRAGSGTFAKSSARGSGAMVLALLIPDLSLRHAEELCRQFIERRVSGVFFAPYELVPEKEEANRRMAEMLREAGIPVVLLDRDIAPFPACSDFDVVGIDNFAGGYLLAEHLLKLGCKRLHFVARPRSAPLPDAFLCANDHTAALLLRALHDARVRVPEKVRVTGFDDVKFATLVSPPLTTAQQPCREIALTAFRAMLDRQADPTLPARHLTLPPRLIVRDSCGAYLSRR